MEYLEVLEILDFISRPLFDDSDDEKALQYILEYMSSDEEEEEDDDIHKEGPDNKSDLSYIRVAKKAANTTEQNAKPKACCLLRAEKFGKRKRKRRDRTS